MTVPRTMELDLFKQAPQLSAHFEAAQWPSRHVFIHGAVTILSTMEARTERICEAHQALLIKYYY